MREFMTKVSDYISERRNDPEKNGGFVVLYLIGMVIAASIILCLLLLWRKNADGKQELEAEVFEAVPETMFTENPVEEELRQQYLMDIEYFGEKIEELSESMTRIRESFETSAVAQDEENTLLRGQVEEITGGITSLISKLESTENTLYDLNELVKEMDVKTIPAIQGEIGRIEKQMEQVNADVSDIYDKIDALETTDKELQMKIREIQGALKTSIEQNISDITNRFEGMAVQIRQMTAQLEEADRQINDTKKQLGDTQSQVDDTKKQLGDTQNQVDDTKKQLGDTQERLRNLDLEMLKYRYDETNNTLYLYENR